MSKGGGKQGTEWAGEWVCGEQAPVMEKAEKRDWGSWRQHLPQSNRAHFSLLQVVFSMTLAICSLCNTDPIPDHTNIPGRSLCYFLDMGMGQGDLGWYNEHRVKAKAAPRGQTVAPFTAPSSFQLGMVLAVCRYFPAIHIFSATNLRVS